MGPNTVNQIKLDEAWPVKDVTDYEKKAPVPGSLDSIQDGKEREDDLRDIIKELKNAVASIHQSSIHQASIHQAS